MPEGQGLPDKEGFTYHTKSSQGKKAHSQKQGSLLTDRVVHFHSISGCYIQNPFHNAFMPERNFTDSSNVTVLLVSPNSDNKMTIVKAYQLTIGFSNKNSHLETITSSHEHCFWKPDTCSVRPNSRDPHSPISLLCFLALAPWAKAS